PSLARGPPGHGRVVGKATGEARRWCIQPEPTSGPRGQLENAVGRKAAAHPTRHDAGVHPDDAAVPVDEHQVDRFAHAERMDQAARTYPECMAPGEPFATEEPAQAIGKAFGHEHLENGSLRGQEREPALAHQKRPSCTSCIAMGKSSTANVPGKMKATSGSSSLTGASIARFSAARNRSLRRCWACARSRGARAS